jgi:hypothetical protein
MPTLRKRKDFAATILTPQGKALSECYAFVDILTTVSEGVRSTTWEGRLTSFSEPQHAYAGLYALRPKGAAETSRIEIIRGAEVRLGVTSDEYEFRGTGAPPQLP